MLKGLTDLQGKISSMRFNVRIVVLASILPQIGIFLYIIVKVIKGSAIKMEEWSGMGILIGAITGLLTGVLYNQRSQKKIEKTEKTEK